MIPKVYIIDDDVQMAEMLSAAVEVVGFPTVVFNNATHFLSESCSEDDVILLDLNMPDMDGIEVIRALASKECKSSLILISGNDTSVLHSAEELARAHSLNIVMSMCKPIQIGILQQLLKMNISDSIEENYSASKNTSAITADELREAIENDRFVLYYQPQVDLKTGVMVGVEALVRWQKEDGGLIYPDEFIPLAEETGVIDDLTSWVIKHAILQSAYCQQSGMNPRVSVNISAKNITSLSLPDQLIGMLKNNQLDSSVLILEITESSLVDELVTSLDILTRLRMKGFDLSIDDFGTGHSTLTHLHRVPFTELKIDKSFVMTMDTDDNAAAIVKTCIILGHELKMKVVAEGVESKAVYNMLSELGCDVAQGYYISPPMPSDELAPWEKSWLQ